jgi:DNA-binding transcriptional LysR family regulator
MARELLVRADEAVSLAHAEGAVLEGRLVIGCYRTAAPFVLAGLVKSFTDANPGVQLEFIEAAQPELERALLDGLCEVALMFTSHIGPGIHMERLYATAPYALLPGDHPRAGDPIVDLRDLAEEPFVLLDVPPSGPYLLSVLEEAGVAPEVRYRSSGYELCRSLVAHGLGWSLLISRPFGDHNYEGLPVVGRPIKGTSPAMDVGLAWAEGVRPTRRALAFAAHCRTLIPEHLGSGIGRPIRIY